MTCRPHRQDSLDLITNVMRTLRWLIFGKETIIYRFLTLKHHSTTRQGETITSISRQSLESELHGTSAKAAISFCNPPDAKNARVLSNFVHPYHRYFLSYLKCLERSDYQVYCCIRFQDKSKRSCVGFQHWENLQVQNPCIM